MRSPMRTAGAFAVIMVDEFQDTNDIQDAIISLIARENNVFRVGDIKQSIYGFRHARPQIMQSYIDHPKAQDAVIYLSNNYRSSEHPGGIQQRLL